MFDKDLYPAAYEVQKKLLDDKRKRQIVCVPQGHRVSIDPLDAGKVAMKILKQIDKEKEVIQ